VTSVFRSGYTLGDRLVRPAVVVVTGPEHDSEPADGSADTVAAQTAATVGATEDGGASQTGPTGPTAG
jgi:molecular chaperone GrpE